MADEAIAQDTGTTVLTGDDQNTGDAASDENSDDAVAAAEGTPAVAADDATAEGDADKGEAGESPDAYADFVAPEGVTLDTELVESATPVFKELGLSQEQAQKLVDIQAAHVQASQQRQADAFNQTKQDWANQSKNDKEFGGDKFNESIADAQLFINEFGSPDLKKLMDDTGLGNHPEVIRAFTRAGKLLKEDSPGARGDASSQTKDRAEQMYSN